MDLQRNLGFALLIFRIFLGARGYWDLLLRFFGFGGGRIFCDLRAEFFCASESIEICVFFAGSSDFCMTGHAFSCRWIRKTKEKRLKKHVGSPWTPQSSSSAKKYTPERRFKAAASSGEHLGRPLFNGIVWQVRLVYGIKCLSEQFTNNSYVFYFEVSLLLSKTFFIHL